MADGAVGTKSRGTILGGATTAPEAIGGGEPQERRTGGSLPFMDRVLYALAWLAFAAVVAVAASLDPAPVGVGTHTQLRLPPCGVWLVFGKPCPSCGMTTAFAWMSRGRWIRGVRAQPAGAAVFLAALGWWLYLPLAALRKRSFLFLFDSPAFLPTVLGLIVVILGVWGYRLAGWP